VGYFTLKSDGVITQANFAGARLLGLERARLVWSGETCITMAMAAGKSAGKSLRMMDKAFKPPTEAAMAMTHRAGSLSSRHEHLSW
jgi:hypothetical protein